MRTRHHLFPALVLLARLATCLDAADQASPIRDPLLPLAPFPSLVAFAASQRVPLDGIVLAPDGAPPRHGDQVVLLLSLERDGATRQWLARLTADDLTDKEGQLRQLPEVVIYSSTGLRLDYPSTRTALQVEFIGPFEAKPAGRPPVWRQARALVGREYLELGLASYCESAMQIIPRLQAAGIAKPFYQGGSSPPSPEALARGKKAAAAFGLTAEEERLAFSVYFGLRAFFTAAMEVPACREVLEEVIQKPSMWSVLGRFGISSNFEYGWQDVRLAPEIKVAGQHPVFLLPVHVALNNTPTLRATLAVTNPHPPLQAGAGILGACVEHPTANDRRLFIRLLSARRSENAK